MENINRQYIDTIEKNIDNLNKNFNNLRNKVKFLAYCPFYYFQYRYQSL